jgi:peroxiredoxin
MFLPPGKRGGLAFLSLLLGLAFLGVSVPARAVTVGESAPGFDLVDLNGTAHTPSEGLGGVLLLYFVGYNATVCQDPAQQLEQDLYNEYHSKGLQIFAIDCWDGSRQQVEDFKQRTGVSFPVLTSGSETASAYGLPYNSFVVIDARGIVRYVSAGPAAGAFDLPTLESAVDHLLQDANAAKEQTWGAIKSLYSGHSQKRLRPQKA